MMKKLKSAKYKLSFYNITLSYNNEDYLWNTYTDACIKLSRDGIKYLDDFTGENDDTEYFKILKTHGFIINSQIDEPGKIIVEEMTIMLNPYPERLGFTIAPGLGCNYQCLYCLYKRFASSFRSKKPSQRLLNTLFDEWRIISK